MDQRRKCWRYMRRLHRRIHLPEIEYIESRNTVGSLSSSVKGKASPLESKAATESINLLFPSPGSPCNSVTLPKGIYGYHSHFTSFGSISLALITSRGTFTFISFSVCFIVLRSPFR